MWGFKTLKHDGGPPLVSTLYQVSWEDRLIQAQCFCLTNRHDLIPCADPAPRSGCGIHAWLPQIIGDTHLHVCPLTDADSLMSVLVWGSGRVIVGERGWRAAEASIEAIISDLLVYFGQVVRTVDSRAVVCTADDLAIIAARCAEYYGVPSLTLDEALELARSQGGALT